MASVDDVVEAGQEKMEAWMAPEQNGYSPFRLRVSERKVVLAVVDYLLLCGALLAALLLVTDLVPDLSKLWAANKWFITLALVWAGVAVVFDVYNLARAASATHTLWSTAAATGLASVVYVAIPWFTPPIVNRSQAFLFILFAVVSVPAWRVLYARLFVQPAFQRRALIVGAGTSGQVLAQALQSDYALRDANPFRGTGYVLLGFVDDDPARRAEKAAGLPVLGDSQNLIRLVRTLAVGEVIVAITHTHEIRPALFEAILDCRELGIPVTTMPSVYERLTGRVAAAFASRNVETATGNRDGAFVRVYGFFKRGVDLVGALVGLLGVAALAPFIMLANALTSPGPLFFRQQRVGEGGRPFPVLKFRSMVPDAEKESGAVWARSGDDRITPLGRILRATHLDELPQAWNVLKGEMSLVGPRPERPEFVGELSRRIAFYRARHCVRPGITGWAQIHQNYGDSLERAREKLEYDLYYVKHASPMLDTVIILRTIAKVLGLRGR